MHDRADEIVARAKEYIETPYRHHGRSITTGVDCIGLVIAVAQDLGISMYNTFRYSRRPNVQEFDSQMIKAGCILLPYSERKNGDILRLSEPRWPVHSVIYEVAKDGSEWTVHAYLPYRKVVREPLTPERDSRISSVWRFPK